MRDDSTNDLATAIAGASTEIERVLKEMRAIQRAVTKLVKAPSPIALSTANVALAELPEVALDTSILNAAVATCRDAVAAHADDRRRALRMSLFGDLRRRAQQNGIAFELLSKAPAVVALAPVTATLDLDGGAATIDYAREVVVTADANVDAIFDGRLEAMERIKAGSVDSPTFFDRLRRAYSMVCQARGVDEGARVDLVDVLLPLGMLGRDVGTWRKRDQGRIEPLPRFLLAYQLHRLRQDKCLALQGRRLDLGVATGGSTRRKTNVLFVPSSSSEGQFYLSIRFVKE